jgi:hypothetical protein
MGGSEASAQIEASGAATRSIEMPLACYLYATAYTFLQSIERSAAPSSNTMVFRFQLSIAMVLLGQGSCSIRVKLEKPRAQGDPLQLQ